VEEEEEEEQESVGEKLAHACLSPVVLMRDER